MQEPGTNAGSSGSSHVSGVRTFAHSCCSCLETAAQARCSEGGYLNYYQLSTEIRGHFGHWPGRHAIFF